MVSMDGENGDEHSTAKLANEKGFYPDRQMHVKVQETELRLGNRLEGNFL